MLGKLVSNDGTWEFNQQLMGINFMFFYMVYGYNGYYNYNYWVYEPTWFWARAYLSTRSERADEASHGNFNRAPFYQTLGFLWNQGNTSSWLTSNIHQ